MVSTISCPQPVATHPNLAIVSMTVPLRVMGFDRVRYVHAHLPHFALRGDCRAQTAPEAMFDLHGRETGATALLRPF